MIVLLTGKIIDKAASELIIECGGVGYGVLCSLVTLEKLPRVGEIATVYTILTPREDAMILFGFADTSEREAFKALTSVGGIGGKIALGILSSISVDDLRKYIIEGNHGALQKLPGVGKKTAERLVVELRDKVVKLFGDKFDSSALADDFTAAHEAISALSALGYNKNVAEKAVKKAQNELGANNVPIEKLIKSALKFAIE